MKKTEPLFAAEPDEFHGQGGTFEVRGGRRVLVTPPTQDHPEGNRAREADGTPINLPAPAAQGPTADAEAAAAGGATADSSRPRAVRGDNKKGAEQ